MFKDAKQRMQLAMEQARLSGDSFKVNEITANVMVGVTMFIIFGVMLLCLVLNEVGVFTAAKSVMRWAVLAAAHNHQPCQGAEHCTAPVLCCTK